MADGIRGKHYDHLPEPIRNGIFLHRAIDTYTDAHPVFRQSTQRLHSKYHHYSGVIVDVFYDHFLAKNWADYSDEKLEDFVARFYQSLVTHYNLLTDKTKSLMPYMIERNWLVSYRTVEGLAKILYQMDRRTNNVSKMQYSVAELQEFYAEFESDFTNFFVDLRQHIAEKMLEL